MFSIVLPIIEYVTSDCCKNCIHFQRDWVMGLISKSFFNHSVMITDNHFLLHFNYLVIIFIAYIHLMLQQIVHQKWFILVNILLSEHVEHFEHRNNWQVSSRVKKVLRKKARRNSFCDLGSFYCFFFLFLSSLLWIFVSHSRFFILSILGLNPS